MVFDIICLFYSEFNIEKGAEIIYQLPQEFIKQDDFLKISEYVIPRTELCDCLISLKLGNSYLMGFPIHLTDKSYERTKFEFSFCILIKDNEYKKNFMIYELLLKKIAKTFESMEIDSGFEFIRNNRHVIEVFLDKLYQEMKTKQTVLSIKIETKYDLIGHLNFYFKYIEFSNTNTEILSYHVPVWLKQIDPFDVLYYEKSVKAVIEEIDGISHVKKISNKLDFDIKYVIYILNNLLLINSITFVDIFQFTNIYKATSLLKTNYQENLLSEFHEFCDINLRQFGNREKYKIILDVYIEDKENNKLNNSILFSLYCELTNSLSVSDFLNKVKHYSINIPLFIAFGIYKKIIRRVHIYSFLRTKEKDQENTTLYNIFLDLLDGKHCLDEICCETNKSLKEVLSIINSIKGSIILYK